MQQSPAQLKQKAAAMVAIGLKWLADEGWDVTPAPNVNLAPNLHFKANKQTFLARKAYEHAVVLHLKTCQFPQLGYSFRSDGTLNIPPGVGVVLFVSQDSESIPTETRIWWLPVVAVKAAFEAKAAQGAAGEPVKPGVAVWIDPPAPPIATIPLASIAPDPAAELCQQVNKHRNALAALLHVPADRIAITITL